MRVKPHKHKHLHKLSSVVFHLCINNCTWNPSLIFWSENEGAFIHHTHLMVMSLCTQAVHQGSLWRLIAFLCLFAPWWPMSHLTVEFTDWLLSASLSHPPMMDGGVSHSGVCDKRHTSFLCSWCYIIYILTFHRSRGLCWSRKAFSVISHQINSSFNRRKLNGFLMV